MQQYGSLPYCILPLSVLQYITVLQYVTRHEKTGLILCTQNIPIHIIVCICITACIRFTKSVNFIRFPMKSRINDKIVLDSHVYTQSYLIFEIQKCGQILCAHKPYFLMLSHIYD